MKNIVILFVVVMFFNYSSWSQPDYAKIRFHSKIKEYKKAKPDFEDLDVKKTDLQHIITLLGSSFYSVDEIEDITEKVWLSIIDPKQFDYVYKDIAVRSIPNWGKKNFKGEIVIEPNPFLALWTLADNEKTYFQSAIGQLLIFYGLMGYAEDAKNTKIAVNKMLYTKTTKFRPIRGNDWTNSYLNAVNSVINPKRLTVQVSAKYDFFICKDEVKDELLGLYEKFDWHFITP